MRRVATILASVCFVRWGITFDAAPFEQGAPFRIEAGGSAPGDRVLAVPLTIRMDGSQRRCPLWTIRALAGSPRNGVWQQLAAAAAQGQETASLRVSSGSRVVLLVTCSGEEGYSLHGPISWPARAASLVVHPRRRRTVRVDRGDRRLRVRLVVPGQPEPSRWPRCVEDSATHVSCIGVPFELSALAVAGHRGDLGWGVAAPDSTTVQEVVLQTGQWGRLVRLVVPRSVGERDLVVTRLREPLSRSGWFHARVRLRRDEQTAVLPVGRHVLWVVGTGDTTERLLEFSGPSVTTRRLAISMLVEGDSVQALDIYLRPSTPVNGVTTDATGTPAGGTVVAVFELVDAVGQTDRNERPPQRRWLAETVSGPDGRFSFSGLDREEYEFLAAHPRHGRAVERVRPDGRSLSLRLQPTPRLQGRVFVAGQVAEGVAVRVVPDQVAFPMTRHRTVFDLSRSIRDEDHLFESPLGLCAPACATPPGLTHAGALIC